MARNLCLIADNYRKRHSKRSTRLSAKSETPHGGYICLNVTPRSAFYAHARTFSSLWCGGMKDRCLCAGSSWQLAAGLLMSLGGSSDGIQSGFITEQEGAAAARAQSPYCTYGERYCTRPLKARENASTRCTLEASACTACLLNEVVRVPSDKRHKLDQTAHFVLSRLIVRNTPECPPL